MIPWEIRGRELANCNCAYGCPCQFNALPTYGTCEAAVGFEIDEGHYGGVQLNGLRAAAVYKFPGPVHEGNGACQLIVDEQASLEQRAVLGKIMTGEDTVEMATMWWIFNAMCSTKYETLIKRIRTSIDIEGRRGTISVEDVFELEAEPIMNPVTGAEHRVRIDLPDGFEYSLAEMGSATTQTTGIIELPNNNNTYAQFAELHLSNEGIVRSSTG